MEIKLKLKLKDGIEIELSEKEIKELKDLLDGLFNTNIINYPIVIPIERWDKWYPTWNYPTVTYDNDIAIFNVSYLG